jgi:hypothetical protein
MRLVIRADFPLGKGGACSGRLTGTIKPIGRDVRAESDTCLILNPERESAFAGFQESGILQLLETN